MIKALTVKLNLMGSIIAYYVSALLKLVIVTLRVWLDPIHISLCWYIVRGHGLLPRFALEESPWWYIKGKD